jgi:hypothetical protein
MGILRVNSRHCDVRAYTCIGLSYIKYSRTSFISFYYITEVLNLRTYMYWGAIVGGPVA